MAVLVLVLPSMVLVDRRGYPFQVPGLYKRNASFIPCLGSWAALHLQLGMGGSGDRALGVFPGKHAGSYLIFGLGGRARPLA